jgi:hypothetical protein
MTLYSLLLQKLLVNLDTNERIMLTPFQHTVVEAMLTDTPTVLVQNHRQVGMTYALAVSLFARAFLNPDQKIVVYGGEAQHRDMLFTLYLRAIVHHVVEQLKKICTVPIAEGDIIKGVARNYLDLMNGSSIASVQNASSLRGMTINKLLVLDDPRSGHRQKFNEGMASMLPCLLHSGSYVISTFDQAFARELVNGNGDINVISSQESDRL